MPLYEYKCTSCGSQFTLLRRMGQSDTDVVCSGCGKTSVGRLFSTFASHSKESSSVGMSMGSDTCESGTCGTGFCGSGTCGFG